MDRKKLCVIGGIVAVLIPIIIVLCLYVFVWNEQEEIVIVSTPAANGGTITPVDKTAASVEILSDGKSAGDAIYEFKSKYGYSLQYNNKYTVDLSGKNYDFYIANSDETVKVAVTATKYSDTLSNIPFFSIQTKEEWDGIMGSMMGESKEFNRTKINGFETLVAHYYIGDQNGEIVNDVLFAILIGDEYIYNYVYTASVDSDEKEQQQIGAVLYTIKQIA